MDPDQTALDLHCLFKRLHNISIDDKNIRLCCNIRFKGILGQVWYLIVSIPDLCNLTYFNKCGFGASTDRTFMNCTQTCAAQATFKRLTNG